MRGPSCSAIGIIGQAIPLVHRASPLILVVMTTECHVNLQTEAKCQPFTSFEAALAHSQTGYGLDYCAQFS